jgi:hypothetical protein
MAFKIVNKDDPVFKEQQRQAWQRIRQSGKAAFVLKRGLLRWGGMMFLIFAAFDVVGFYLTDHQQYVLDYMPVLLVVNAIIWSLCGLAWGFWAWNKCERLYPGSATSPSAKRDTAD